MAHRYKSNPAALVLVNPGEPPKKREYNYKPRNQKPPRKYFKGTKAIPKRPNIDHGDPVTVGEPVVRGPRRKPIRGRRASGWQWVDSHRRKTTRTGAKGRKTKQSGGVRGYLQYWENPEEKRNMRKKSRRKPAKRRTLAKRRVVRKTLRRKAAKRRTVRKPASRKITRKRALKRNPAKRRRIVRRKTRKLSARRVRRNPIRKATRRPIRRRKAIRRTRRTYRNPLSLGELAKKSASVGAGFLSARLASNLLVRFGGQLSPTLVQHSGLLGDVVAIAAAYFVPKKVKALKPYQMHLVLGAGASLFVDLVDQYLIPAAPQLAPWIGVPMGGSIAAFETALVEGGDMGEYIDSPLGSGPLGEYFDTGDPTGEALAGGLYGDPSDDIEVLDEYIGMGEMEALDGAPFDVRIVPSYPATYKMPFRRSNLLPNLTRPVQYPMQGAPQSVMAIGGQLPRYSPRATSTYGTTERNQGIFDEDIFN